MVHYNIQLRNVGQWQKKKTRVVIIIVQLRLYHGLLFLKYYYLRRSVTRFFFLCIFITHTQIYSYWSIPRCHWCVYIGKRSLRWRFFSVNPVGRRRKIKLNYKHHVLSERATIPWRVFSSKKFVINTLNLFFRQTRFSQSYWKSRFGNRKTRSNKRIIRIFFSFR